MRDNSTKILEQAATLPGRCPVCDSAQFDIAVTVDSSHQVQAVVKYGCNGRLRTYGKPDAADRWEQQCSNAQKVALAMIEKHGPKP